MRARRIEANAMQWLAGAAAVWALAAGSSAHAEKRSNSCTADSDCGEGYECDLGPVGVSTRDCPPDAGACEPTPSDPVPAEPRTGECEPKEMTCEVDSDCLSGLTCVHHDDSDCAAIPPSAADAGAAPSDEDVCGPSEPSPGECVYRFVTCKKDSDCDGGFVCTALGTESECSSDEETCTETTRSYCFPPRVDCENSDDCDAGTRCVALSADAQEDPPAAWKGATALCVPEVIALVLEERVEAAGVSAGTSKSASDSAGEDEGETADGGTAAAGGSNDGGCSVSGPGISHGDAGWMLLLGAAVLYAQRRRFARPR
jgi:hypothetical protein